MCDIKVTKCYYCLCQVCNMRKCPVQRTQNREVLCYKSCWSQNRFIPRLECDYFEHFRKTKKYIVKSRIVNRPMYTSQQVGEMLAKIIEKMEREENE